MVQGVAAELKMKKLAGDELQITGRTMKNVRTFQAFGTLGLGSLQD